MTAEREAEILVYRIENLKARRDDAIFQIKECEARLRQLAVKPRQYAIDRTTEAK